MEIFTANINLKDEKNNESIKTVIDEDISVKDIYPDIKNIIDSEVELSFIDAKIDGDKINIRGEINVNVIYLTDDFKSELTSINEKLSFQENIIIKDKDIYDFDTQEMFIDIKPTYLKVSMLSSRKINAKVALDIDVIKNNSSDIDVVSNVDSSRALKKKKKINIEEISDSCFGEVFIQDKYNIPSTKPEIIDLLRCDIELCDTQVAEKGDNCVLSANAKVKMLYTSSEDGEIIYDKFSIPVRENLNITATLDDASEVTYSLKTLVYGKNIYIAKDQNGEDKEVNVDFKIAYVCFQKANVEKEILQDAFIIDKKLNLEKKEIKCKTLLARNTNVASFKNIVKINGKDIIEVFDSKANVSITSNEVKDDIMTVKGIINLSIYAVQSDSARPIIVIKKDIPFVQNIQIKGAQESTITCKARNINITQDLISSDEVEIKSTFTLEIESCKNVKEEVIVSCSIEDDKKEMIDNSSVKIYIANDNEKIYDVAKKYCAEKESITLISKGNVIDEVNEDTNVSIGDKVIIF